jgi:alginate O-acetyltransferase complex protein AlgI
MGFSQNVFIYMFIPVFLVTHILSNFLSNKIYFLKKIRLDDIIILVAGFLFYSWACFNHIAYLIGIIIIAYLFAYLISKSKNTDLRRILLISGIVISVLLLLRFKYLDYIIRFFKLPFEVKNLVAPLGISFIVFSVISYLNDVYKGEPCGDILDAAIYFSFFPKVISGPTVLWKNFNTAYKNRTCSAHMVAAGIDKIIIGLVKKVVFADYFGTLISTILSKTGGTIDVPTAWGICLVYMLQIYLDFAGYSDIAIGLSKIIGIDINENFNFPYTSLSITEFWRRWHISLTSFFKEYVYIPLGGSRKGKVRTLVNIFIVFLISGIWHGTGVIYLAWGIMHGVCQIIERLLKDTKFYKSIPSVVKWFFTMFIVMIGWEMFRIPHFHDFVNFAKQLVGISASGNVVFKFKYFFSTKAIVMITTAFFGSTLLRFAPMERIKDITANKTVAVAAKDIVMIGLFVVVLICITNSTYNPFIYFQY